MAFRVSYGRFGNILTRLLAAPTMTPSADAAFPVAGLYDGRANLPAKFGSIAADSTVVVDINAIPDPSFETGVSNWTAVAGTMDQSAVQKNSGTYSARFVAAGDWKFRFYARAGEVRQISAALYGGGGAVASIVRLYCVETGHYLQSGGASWAAGSSDLFSRTTASWATSTQAYTVETLAVTFADVVTLEIHIVQVNAGTTYRDDVIDVPGVTFSSVHGHNLGATIVPKVQSSPDNSAWTDRITPATGAVAIIMQRDSFYGTTGAMYYRYWRLLLNGTPGAVPWIGEWWLGQSEALVCAPDYPLRISHDEMQVRNSTPQGSPSIYLRGSTPLRRVTLALTPRNDAQHQQLRDGLFRGSRGGRYPLVLVPTETDSDTCIMGRCTELLDVSRPHFAYRSYDLEIDEEPLPQMG